jgi:DNA invertase Pin-like site-specific DNA recombinase
MNVVLYGRVSTKDKQDVTNQLKQLREFCDKQGWVISHEYVDRVSGKRSDNRPEFQEMLLAASKRQFDLLLFWSLDRLSREGALATLKHLEVLSGCGIKYRSFTEPYLDTLGPFGDAIVSLLACIARQERTRLSERVLAGLNRARAAGRIGGRPNALTQDKKAEARKLRRAGLSFGVIADRLHVSKPTIMRVCRD